MKTLQSKTTSISESALPKKYLRKPISPLEMQAIEVSGRNLSLPSHKLFSYSLAVFKHYDVFEYY